MASPLEQYSPCPGGTGKKIRFCCKELLPELQRIDRMMEGGQWHACVEQIDRLQQKYPGRACLFALKGEALAALERYEELEPNAEAFVARHPDNPLAHAEMACAAAYLGKAQAAIASFLKALACCREETTRRQLERHLWVVAEGLMDPYCRQAVRALIEAWGGKEATVLLDMSDPAPLWAKEPRALVACPPDFPWKAEFDEALQLANSLRWFEAERAFTALAERANGVPAVWQNLMIVRGWVADYPRAAEAARRYAGLVESDEDAAELEAYAAYITGEMLGDAVQVPKIEYPVIDLQSLRKALEKDPGVTPLVLVRTEEEKPVLEQGEFYRLVGPPIPPHDVPEWACLLSIVPATAESPPELTLTGASPEWVAEGQKRLEALAGGSLGPGRSLPSDHGNSITGLYFWQEDLLKLDDIPPARKAVLAERRETFLRQRFPSLPLRLLHGKSFQEGLADSALRRRALGAVLLLEELLRHYRLGPTGEDLRVLLGLSPRGPIDPREVPPATVPLARLHLVDVEKLTGEQLIACFQRAWRFSAGEALARLAPALAHNDTIPWSPTRVAAAVVTLAQEPNYARALVWCQRWRQEARHLPGACGKFDIEEAWIRLHRGELDDIVELTKHLRAEHAGDPGIPEAFLRFRQALEAHVRGVLASARRAREPSIVAPDGGQPGKLWTPDSARTPGDRPTLWTPGNP